MTESSDKLAPSKNNGSRSVFSSINNSRPASEKNDGDNKVDRFGVDSNDLKHAKKLKKLKGKKLAKSRKLSKSKGKKLKKPSKSGNLPNFGIAEAGPNFLIFGTREAFNHLRLAFTKAPILQHFDPKCHI